MSSQLDRWNGEFGREYTDRNQVDWRTRVEGFRQMIPAETQTVLEVGCNSGHNLVAIEQALGGNRRVFGSEPNAYARQIARDKALQVYDRSIYEIGWLKEKHPVELAFTSGVLIHVPDGRFDEALDNMYRCATKYILAIEYDAQPDVYSERIDYRGHADMLWKRNYGKHYTRLFPDLKLIGVGDGIPGFERDTYWLLEK